MITVRRHRLEGGYSVTETLDPDGPVPSDCIVRSPEGQFLHREAKLADALEFVRAHRDRQAWQGPEVPPHPQ